jgi:hypothetical protein
MKNIKEPKLLKVRVKNGGDTYYTYSHWQHKEIEGIVFVPVNKTIPSNELTQQIHYLRKDWLEYIK